MTENALPEKWVARFKNPDGTDNMGIANHHTALNMMVANILSWGGTHIVITDESYRPRIIDITGEHKDEQSSEIHAGTIRHSTA